jgi:hypothetical protein
MKQTPHNGFIRIKQKIDRKNIYMYLDHIFIFKSKTKSNKHLSNSIRRMNDLSVCLLGYSLQPCLQRMIYQNVNIHTGHVISHFSNGIISSLYIIMNHKDLNFSTLQSNQLYFALLNGCLVLFTDIYMTKLATSSQLVWKQLTPKQWNGVFLICMGFLLL